MSTVLTVVSAVCAAAYRWIAVARTSRVRCWQVSLSDLLVLEDQPADLVAQVVLEAAEQQLAGLVGAELGEPVQLRPLLVQDLRGPPDRGGQRLLLLGQAELDRIELAFAAMDQLQLLVEQVGPLLEPFLLLPEDLAALFRLGLDRLAAAKGLVLRPEFGLLLDRLGLQPRLVQDLLGQAARRPGPQPGHPEDAGQAARDPRGQQSDGAYQSCPVHVGVFPFLVETLGQRRAVTRPGATARSRGTSPRHPGTGAPWGSESGRAEKRPAPAPPTIHTSGKEPRPPSRRERAAGAGGTINVTQQRGGSTARRTSQTRRRPSSAAHEAREWIAPLAPGRADDRSQDPAEARHGGSCVK